MEWSIDQQKVIDSRDVNLLVSAAAGSGKTAVLVERIIGLLTGRIVAGVPTKKIDVDSLLVLTFTNAAASEMRERVSKRLQELIEESNGNIDPHLIKQSALIHHAQITTIDSFCMWLVKNYFEQCDVEPGFRMMDEGERKLLEEDIATKVIEEAFEEGEDSFNKLASRYIVGKRDSLTEMVLDVYKKASGFAYPKRWLKEISDINMTLEESDWNREDRWFGAIKIDAYTRVKSLIEEVDELSAFCIKHGISSMDNVIKSMKESLETLLDTASYDEFRAKLNLIKFPNANVKGVEEELANKVKDKKGAINDTLKSLREKSFFMPYAAIKADSQVVMENTLALVSLVNVFYDRLDAVKKKKNAYDFADIEHKALNILVDEATGEPTQVALDLRATYNEIMVDEYQDSNYLQEAILEAIANGHDRFIVGDVKQSIYRFRQGKPELFNKKKREYQDKASGEVILLDKNYRSRQEVLDSVNDIFFNIMREHTGGVHYGEEESLKLGGTFEESEYADKYKTEIMLVDAKDFDEEDTDKIEAEARCISKRISALINEGYLYSDIVILMRSTNWADEVKKILEDSGIPAHLASSKGYFATTEVETLISFIKTIDNPCQDIPIIAVMKSPLIDTFSDSELLMIRNHTDGHFFYNCVEGYADDGEEIGLRNKCKKLLEIIDDYRIKMRISSVSEILRDIVEESLFLDYLLAMPGGERRVANVNMLLEKAISFEKTSYSGVFSFIRYIDELREFDIDFGEADLIDEKANVVRIMTIHKSKGLQFPVVFVVGCGRELSKMDYTGNLLIDDTLGLGFKVVDPDNRSKRDHIYRQLITNKIKTDGIGEEERVLYVALTRAQKKLIITGTIKDVDKRREKYNSLAGRLSHGWEYTSLAENEFKTYLDMIMPSAINNPAHFIFSYIDRTYIDQLKAAEAMMGIRDAETLLDSMESCDNELYRQIDEKLTRRYVYEGEVNLKLKMSVSEIKHKYMHKDEDSDYRDDAIVQNTNFNNEDNTEEKLRPSFITGKEYQVFTKDSDANDGAKYGTAMHRFLEIFDYGALRASLADAKIDAAGFMDANTRENEAVKSILQKEIKRQLVGNHESGIIDDDTYTRIRTDKIASFMQSDIASRVILADEENRLHREQPFVMAIDYNEADQQVDSDEKVLIQGIIDLFFIEDNKIILLDYKTDRIDSPNALVQRYKKQLELYGQALSRYYGLELGQVLMYSFSLDAEVLVQ